MKTYPICIFYLDTWLRGRLDQTVTVFSNFNHDNRINIIVLLFYGNHGAAILNLFPLSM